MKNKEYWEERAILKDKLLEKDINKIDGSLNCNDDVPKKSIPLRMYSIKPVGANVAHESPVLFR